MRYFKVQRLRQGIGPWVDDICGEWLTRDGQPWRPGMSRENRVWVRGFTREEAEEMVRHVEAIRERQRRESPVQIASVPPRRIVPLDHPTNDPA